MYGTWLSFKLKQAVSFSCWRPHKKLWSCCNYQEIIFPKNEPFWLFFCWCWLNSSNKIESRKENFDILFLKFWFGRARYKADEILQRCSAWVKLHTLILWKGWWFSEGSRWWWWCHGWDEMNGWKQFEIQALEPFMPKSWAYLPLRRFAK